MKIELQVGDTITIPDGYKAIIKDGSVVFEKGQEFKDGDILAYANYSGHRCPFIYKNTDTRGNHQFYAGVNCGRNLIISDEGKRWGNGTLCYATYKEKQILFNKMKEQGLRWNAEEKRVEKIRWRAKYGEKYYFLNSNFSVDCVKNIDRWFDDIHYNSFCQFRTEEYAKEAAKRVKETLRKYHEEIGE